MRLVRRQPCLALRRYVEFYWLVSTTADEASQPFLVVPDGRTELVILFGGPVEHQVGEGALRAMPRCALSGQLSTRMLTRAEASVGVVAARFWPGGAARFFDLPMHELADDLPDLEAILGAEASALARSVAAAPGDDACFGAVERFLLARLGAGEDDPVLLEACRLITSRADDGIAIDALADRVGYSKRQLARKFRDRVGIAPAKLRRVARLQRVFGCLAERPTMTLTEAAHVAGYYDQAHFNRDFLEFCGTTPGAYFGRGKAV